MKKLINAIETIFTAITFAEAGELEYAQVLMNSKEYEQDGQTELCKTSQISVEAVLPHLEDQNMEELLIHNMRNAMVFCALVATITLFPSPILYVQRAVERAWDKIHSRQHAGEKAFCEIDMTTFDASDKKQFGKVSDPRFAGR